MILTGITTTNNYNTNNQMNNPNQKSWRCLGYRMLVIGAVIFTVNEVSQQQWTTSSSSSSSLSFFAKSSQQQQQQQLDRTSKSSVPCVQHEEEHNSNYYFTPTKLGTTNLYDEENNNDDNDHQNIRFGSIKLPGLQRDSPVLSLSNMTDLIDDDENLNNVVTPRKTTTASNTNPPEYWQDVLNDRAPVVRALENAGVKMDWQLLQRLPTWNEVVDLYGDVPIIVGKERCEEFRQTNHPSVRTASIAGQFNTGTNAMAMYFGQNLRRRPSTTTDDDHDEHDDHHHHHDNNNKNRVAAGFMANVPWHKHGWVDLRGKYDFKPPRNVTQVMPVVIIRDPYGWFHSMCESPYLMKGEWKGKNCPNFLVSNRYPSSRWIINNNNNNNKRDSIPAKLTLGKGFMFVKEWDSLVHVWSEWYGEYYDAKFPRLMIRFEDLLFHTPVVMDAIRECVGGVWAKDEFVYQVASSKGGKKYFEDIKPQSSMISAIIKYGQDKNGRRTHNMTKGDLKFVKKHLDDRLMKAFHYKHPGMN